jgi:hypothetical protein
MRQLRLETSANEIHTLLGRPETVRCAVPLLSVRACGPRNLMKAASVTALFSARGRRLSTDSGFPVRRGDAGRCVVGDFLFGFQAVLNVAAVVKGGVTFEHSPWLFDRLPQ